MWFRTPGTDGRGHNFSHSSFTSTSPSTFLSCLKQICTLFHSSQLIPSLHLREERDAICKLTLLPCHHSKCRAAHKHRTRTSFRLSRTQATVLKYREAMHGKKRTLHHPLSLSGNRGTPFTACSLMPLQDSQYTNFHRLFHSSSKRTRTGNPNPLLRKKCSVVICSNIFTNFAGKQSHIVARRKEPSMGNAHMRHITLCKQIKLNDQNIRMELARDNSRVVWTDSFKKIF